MSSSDLPYSLIAGEAKFMVPYERFQKEQQRSQRLEETVEILNGVIKTKDKQICELQSKIDDMKMDIDKLTTENKEMRTKITSLTNEITSLTNDKLIDKVIIAIQDVNYSAHLESTYNYLFRLRTRRLGQAHYMIENEDDLIKGYKMKIIRDVLIANKGTIVENKLNRIVRQNVLFDDMIGYLGGIMNDGIGLTEEDKDDAKMFWE